MDVLFQKCYFSPVASESVRPRRLSSVLLILFPFPLRFLESCGEISFFAPTPMDKPFFLSPLFSKIFLEIACIFLKTWYDNG